MCGLVLLLSFCFIKDFQKLNKLCVCCEFITDSIPDWPGVFCFKSNVLGSDRVCSRLGFTWSFRSWKQAASPLVYKAIIPLWLIYVVLWWLVCIYSFCIKRFDIIFYSFRCKILMWCSSFFYSNISFFLFSPSNFFLLTIWGSVLGFLASNTGLCIVVENSSVEFFPESLQWYQSYWFSDNLGSVA